jgi:hypothetical protein
LANCLFSLRRTIRITGLLLLIVLFCGLAVLCADDPFSSWANLRAFCLDVDWPQIFS